MNPWHTVDAIVDMIPTSYYFLATSSGVSSVVPTVTHSVAEDNSLRAVTCFRTRKGVDMKEDIRFGDGFVFFSPGTRRLEDKAGRALRRQAQGRLRFQTKEASLVLQWRGLL